MVRRLDVAVNYAKTVRWRSIRCNLVPFYFKFNHSGMGTIKVLVVGCGNMGASHARAYHDLAGFEICGLVSRGNSKIDTQ